MLLLMLLLKMLIEKTLTDDVDVNGKSESKTVLSRSLAGFATIARHEPSLIPRFCRNTRCARSLR